MNSIEQNNAYIKELKKDINKIEKFLSEKFLYEPRQDKIECFCPECQKKFQQEQNKHSETIL